MRRAIKHIVLILMILICEKGFSQGLTSRAHALYSEKNYDSARVWIDSAIVTLESSNSQTWQLRGLIYRKLETPANITYREISINSFLEAKKVDTDNLYSEKIEEYLINTIIRYYNDAVTFLNENKFSESEKSYIQYKQKYLSLINSKEDFKTKDIEFYNALGASYTRQLSQISGKEYDIVFALAINALSKVLEADPVNYLANLNTAVLYYNKGADLIVNLDPINTPMDVFVESLTVSEELFLKALPKMLTAHSINPESVEVIEGLTGIYFGLHDDSNWTIYQTKLDKINLPIYLESIEKNPNDKETLKQLVRIYSSTIKDETQYAKYRAMLDKIGG